MTPLEKLGFNNEQISYLKSIPEIKQSLQEKGWLKPPVTKKLKIKQQDGTFGVGIPYGTEAKYVDTIDADGNEITLEENLQQLKAYIDNEINNIIEGSY